MTRDLQYKIRLYNDIQRYRDSKSFYASDILEIIEMNKARKEPEALYHSILDALQAGFMIGYSAAQEDAKEERKAYKK